MTSIFQQVLGSDFNKLHPKIQKRFGFSSEDHLASIGRGVMERVWRGRGFTLPFLHLGATRRIMFPETGENVPFTVRNYAYRDSFGRETVTWLREFGTRPKRRFDAYMILSESRRCIVDYLGTHQHLATDLDLRVDSRGSLCIRSGQQRFYEGVIGFRFPMVFSGVAHVCEWFDDRTGKFRIDVEVNNRFCGPLFGYRGWFDAEWFGVDEVPADVFPVRAERRE